MCLHTISPCGNKTVRGKQNRRHNLRVATWRIGGRHPKAVLPSIPISIFFMLPVAGGWVGGCRNCSVSGPRCRTYCDGDYLSNDAPKHRIAIARKNYSSLDLLHFAFWRCIYFCRYRIVYCAGDEVQIILSCWQALRCSFHFDCVRIDKIGNLLSRFYTHHGNILVDSSSLYFKLS